MVQFWLNGARVEVVHGSLKFEHHEEREGGALVEGGGEREGEFRGRGWLLVSGLTWALFAAGDHNGNCMVVAAVQETRVIGSGSTHHTHVMSSMMKQVGRASRGLQRRAAGDARIHTAPYKPHM